MTTSCLRWQRPARLLLRVSAICWLLVSMAAYAALGATVNNTGPITGGKGIKYIFQTPLLYFTVSEMTGCFGDGRVFPGLSFDGNGTTTFATDADFITRGNPRDAFHVSGNVSGVPFFHTNNNGRSSFSITGGSFVDSSDSSKVNLTWTASSANYTISSRYTTDPTKPYIQVATTITAIASITGLRFGRSCDPDQDSSVGTSRTVNTCGWTDGSLTASSSDIVIASGPIRPTLIMAMYTNDATPHGAGVSSGWSDDPVAYFNQCTDGDGDYAIGLSFNIGDLAAGASHTVRYTYAFASRTADFKVLLQALTSEGSACGAGATACSPNIVTTVMVKFNGTQWTVALSVSRATVIRNLRESVAAALGLPVESVEVLNVAVGSLIVTYQVTRSSTSTILDSDLHRIAQTEAAYSTLLSWYLATTGEIATLSSYVVVEYNEVPPTTDVVIPLVVVGSVLCVVALLSVRWWVLRRPSVVVVTNQELSTKVPTHDPVV